MGTKTHPGEFDCYAFAEADEPVFVLLGRDAAAPHTVREWAATRLELGKNEPGDRQIVEAHQCADAMRHYADRRDADDHARRLDPGGRVGGARVAAELVLDDAVNEPRRIRLVGPVAGDPRQGPPREFNFKFDFDNLRVEGLELRDLDHARMVVHAIRCAIERAGAAGTPGRGG